MNTRRSWRRRLGALVGAGRTRRGPGLLLWLTRSADPDLGEVIEPALARWDHTPAREVWLSRIGQPPPHRLDVVLAIRCLGIVRDEQATQRLHELALSSETAPSLRVAAARVLAELRTSGSEAAAQKLSGDVTPTGRIGCLVAASLLRRHEGAETIRLLQALAKNKESAVALVAVTRLSELLAPSNVLPVLVEVLGNEGADVRGHGVAAMIQNPSDDYVRALTRALSDPHPAVRVRARRGLRELATDRRALVIDSAPRG